MGLGTRIYAALLLLGAASFAGPEVLSRPGRGFGATDLRRSIRVSIDQYDAAERRLRSGTGRVGDDEAQVLARARLTDLWREAHLRDLQTGSLVLVTLGSLVFALSGIRRSLRRDTRPSGVIEVAADQTVKVQPEALGTAMSTLSPSREDAIARLRGGARIRCGYCSRLSKWKTLGRVGRRIFVKPDDADANPLILAEGWWSRGCAPEPCSKCGSKQTLEG